MGKNFCPVCKKGHDLEVMDFGKLPIAHHLLDTPDPEEYRHSLSLLICDQCGIVRIADPCPPEKLYLDYNYNFSSWKPEPHIPHETDMIMRGMGRVPGSIFEIGCNDGSFLSRFNSPLTERRIGLEPNPFPAGLAIQKGIFVINEFLNLKAVNKVVGDKGAFDLVVARQVLEHLHDFNLFFQCLNTLLPDDGFVFIDVPDSENGFLQGDCSIIWDEHVTYFCEASLIRLFDANGYVPVELKKFNFSGGIMSCLFKRKDHASSKTWEKDPSGFVSSALRYSGKIRMYGDLLKKLIRICRQKDYAIAVYGVGCRGTMLVNGLNIGLLTDVAIDDQVERQGKYMPGTRLLIHDSRVIGEHDKILIILTVGQENDEKVKVKINPLFRGKEVIILSACTPAPVFEEVEQALLKFGV